MELLRQLRLFATVLRSAVKATMTFTTEPRRLLQISLRSYGEEVLARRVPSLSDVEMSTIREIARRHEAALGKPKKPRGPSDRLTRKVSRAEPLAAVEVMEGIIRPLKGKRRLIKGIFEQTSLIAP
jgi:hypothetical protein